MTKNKRLFLTAIGVFCLANLFEFLLLFIPNYVLEVDIGYAEYGRIFINKFIEFSIPLLAAIILFAQRDGGWKWAAAGSAGFSATRLIYLLPNYYLYFIDPSQINYSYDSVEALSLSLVVSIFGALLMFGQIMLFYAIIKLVARISAKKEIIKDLPPKKQNDMDRETKAKINRQADNMVDNSSKIDKIFDLSAPLTLGIFSAAFCQFIIYFIYESIDAIQYFISVSGTYRMGEIIYMMISYLFILVELLVVHAIGCKITEKARTEEE